MKKILAVLLFCLTFQGYSQTTLTLGRMDTLCSTGQMPNATNMNNILYTLYNRPGSGNNNAPLFFVTAATTTTLAPVTYSSGTLTAVSNGRLANVDGVKLALGDSVLIKNQSAQLQNGIYIITDTGTTVTKAKMYRNPRYDATGEIYPSQVNVLSGTINSGLYFLETTINPIVGTSPIVYTSIPAPTSWLLKGNSGTTAGTNYIGTNDAQPFAITTNSSEKARFLTNGNLGLGTTTPTNDLSFGSTANRKMWIENTDSVTAGKSFTIQAGSTIAGGAGGGFISLAQTSRNYRGMAAAPNGDVYVCVYNGDIYKQTGGVGNFVALSQTSRTWYAMAAAPNGNVYACVYGGDIYMQTGGTGNFVSLSQGSGNWIGMCAAPNGDVYVCTNNGAGAGDIYKQTGGVGSFVSLSQTSRSWFGMCAAPNGDVYASVNGGDIYKQTGGSGNFIALSQASRAYQDMAGAPNGDIYVAVNGGDIYKQTGGTGSFVALSQASRSWFGMTAAPNGDVYAGTTSSANIYKQSGGVDVAGGNLNLSSGQSKGLGTSNIIFQTATTNSVSGTTLNPITTKMIILGSGNVGIGTTTPEAKLQIGDTTNNGSFKYVDGNEAYGNVLTSDSLGNAVWRSLSSPNSSPLYFAKAATTASLAVSYSSGTITATSNGRLANQDGITLTLFDNFLLKNQPSALQNGLYVIYDTGTTSSTFKAYRDSSYNDTPEIYPSQVNVLSGIVNGGSYFLQTTVDPVIGTDPIVFVSTPAPTAIASPLSFVDVVLTTPLPNSPVYASGSVSGFPAQNATYTSSTNVKFPTIGGVVPYNGMKVLVAGQADSTKNGDYILIDAGNSACPFCWKWKLQRVSYTASMLYPHLWEVLQGTNKGAIYQQNNRSLVNANIGISGNIVFSNTLSITGIWAIYNSLGVPTFYSTYNLAAAAATSGQTIELMTDITQSVDVNILKPGVNINGNGHTLTMTTSNTIAGFIDNGVTYNGKVINLSIIKTATNSTNPVMYLTNSLTTIDFTGTTITTSGSGTYGIVSNAKKISNFNVSAGDRALSMSNGTAENFNATNTNGGAVVVASNSRLIRGTINDNGVSCSALFQVSGGCTLDYCDVISSSSSTIGYNSSSGINYFNYCTGSLQASDGISSAVFQGNGSEFLTFCRAISPGCVGFYACGNISHSYAYSSGYIAMYQCIINDNCTYIGGRSVFQAVSTAAPFTLKNCVIKNITDASGANAIYLQTDGCVITNCDISVANASAYCITGDASHSVQYANNTFQGATTPLNNVTQYINVGNVSDSQGNVNINH